MFNQHGKPESQFLMESSGVWPAWITFHWILNLAKYAKVQWSAAGTERSVWTCPQTPYAWQKVGKGTLPWTTPCLRPSRFFFKWEENKYSLLYAYCFLFKSDLLNPKFVGKKLYFILFLLESYFFDEQSEFLDVRFYWNKKVKQRFIHERKLK